MSVAVHTPARGRATLWLIVAGVSWGTGGLAGVLLAAHAALHPLSVAAYRLLLGGALLVVLLLVTGRARLSLTPVLVRRVFIVGLLLAVFQASYFAAVTLISVSLATMITIGSAPVFVTVATSISAKRLPAPITIVSLSVAVLGLALLTWSPSDFTDRQQLLSGIGSALLAGVGFAALTVVTRTPVPGLDSLRTAAYGCLTGGVLLLPFAAEFGMAIPLRAEAVAAALYLAAVPTALAYAAYFRGLRDSHPVLAALAALLEPLTAALLATLLLGDRLGVVGWFGCVLLLAALALGQVRHEQS